MLLLLALAGTGPAQAAGDSIFIFDLKKVNKDQIDEAETSKESNPDDESVAPQSEASDDEDSRKSQDRPS